MVADLTSKKFIDEFYCFGPDKLLERVQNNIRKFPPIGALKDLRRKAEAVPPHFRAASGARPERQIHLPDPYFADASASKCLHFGQT